LSDDINNKAFLNIRSFSGNRKFSGKLKFSGKPSFSGIYGLGAVIIPKTLARSARIEKNV